MRKNQTFPIPAPSRWVFRLYVAGQSIKSIQAYGNLRKICDAHLDKRYHIELIDLAANPHLARLDQIIAIPTLVRRSPSPARKVIGDLSNTEKVLAALGIPTVDGDSEGD